MQPARFILFFLALIAFGAIAIAILYFENYLLLEPCPYCMLQRGILLLFGVIFLLNGIFVKRGRKFLASLFAVAILAVMLLGLFISGKHSWMQLNPAPSLGYCEQTTLAITEVFNYQIVKDLLAVGGDCSVVDWTFLSLSIPMWTFLLILGLGIVGIYLNIGQIRYVERRYYY